MAHKLLYIQLMLLGIWYLVPGWDTFSVSTYDAIRELMSWSGDPEVVYGTGFVLMGVAGMYASERPYTIYAFVVCHLIPVLLSGHLGMMAAARIESGAVPMWIAVLAMHVHFARQISRISVVRDEHDADPD